MIPVSQRPACGSYRHWLLAASLFVSGLHPGLVLSAPTGGEVVSGEGHIEQQGNRTDVIQQSGHMVVDWQEFNIGQQEHVHFEQPDTGAAVLNRVYQGGESQILGRMTGRGQVWLLNPNGVLFGRGARVEVGSLVAAGLWMDAGDFMAGRYVLDARHGAGRVHNAGILEASSVGLAGSSVENTGQVLAYSGHVELAAGTEVAVDFAGDGLLRFAVREGSGGEVLNTGELSGKAVALSARAASQVFSGVLNTGQQAAGLSRDAQGRVRLTATSEIQAENVTAEGETIAAAGTVDVSGDQGEGGQVQLSGAESVVLSGSINASSSVAAGGRVTVVAEQIEVLASTRVDVSGARGGGQIEIGGGYRGARVLGRTAESLTVESGAEFRADATAHGDGGQAVFWSEGTTRFGGYASARGGEHSGDGGQVEVSGREHLWWGGRADLRAPHGRTGELLLDPGTVRICDDTDTTGCVASGMDVFTDAALVTMLGTADVTIATSAASSGTEDINVDSAVEVDWGSTSTNTLTLDAGNDINLAGTFTAAAGTLALNVGGTLSLGEASLAVGTVSAGQLTSSTGDQTLSGPTAGATWTVNGGGAGNLVYGSQTVGFTGMEHLAGGTGVDSFTVTAAHTGNLSGGDGDDEFVLDAALTGILDGGADTDVLRGRDAVVTWVLSGVDAGTYDGQAFTAIENLEGGSGADTFNLSLGGQVTGGITDTGGIDTLESATMAGATFTLAAGNTYESGSLTTRFSDLETLQGGDGADTFAVTAAYTGTLSGGGGDDEFVLDATLTGILDGGTDIDVLRGRDAAVTWVLDGMDAGTYDGQDFTAIEHLTGGSGADTFTLNSGGTLSGTIAGDAGGNIYNLAGGMVTGGIVAGADGDTFAVMADYMDDLAGGEGPDTFRLGAVVTGIVSGGGGNDRYELGAGGRVTGGIIDTGGVDTLESTTTAGATFTLAASNTYESAGLVTEFSDLENLQGGDGTDTLQGPDAAATWTVSGVDTGDLEYGTRTVKFSGMETLQAGVGDDLFMMAGGMVTGRVSGGSGMNTLDYSAHDTALVLSVSGRGTEVLPGVPIGVQGTATALGMRGFDQITNVTGSTMPDTLNGLEMNMDSTWTLTDDPDKENDAYRNGDGLELFFNGIENLVGGARGDNFIVSRQHTGNLVGGGGTDAFNINAVFAGMLDGGAGADTLQGRDVTVTWALSGAGAGTYDGQSFTGMENLAGGTGADTLQGRNADLSWTVTSMNAGAHDGYTFTGMENLAGGSGVDTFTLGGAVTGTVSGGAGADGFTLQVSGNAGTLAGGTGADTLQGRDADLNWTVTGMNAGTHDGNTFTGMENLAGGSGVDTFTLGGAVTGTVSGGAGADVFILQSLGSVGTLAGGMDTDTLQGRDANLVWTVTGAGAGTHDGNTFTGMENLAGGSGADTLQGRDANLVWTVTGAGAGTYDGYTFTGMENLAGGSGVDTFTLGGAVTGTVSGGAGADVFTLQVPGSVGTLAGGTDTDTLEGRDANLVWTVTGAGAGTHDGNTFTGMENLAGGTGTDTLQGRNADLSWTVTGVNAGTHDGHTFTGMENLAGGSGADTFTLASGGMLSGAIAGNAGGNTYNLAGGTATGGITAGADGDTFTVTADFTGSLTGGTGGDTFRLGAVVTGMVSGGGGDDRYELGAGGQATLGITATGGIDTLASTTTAAAIFTLGATHTYESASLRTTFSGMDRLVGGSGADTFMVERNYMGDLSGGAGPDVFDIGSGRTLTGTVQGGSGDNQYVLRSGGSITGAITGGDDADHFQFFSGSMADGIVGGAGVNHLDYSSSLMSVAVQLVRPGTNAGFAGTAPAVTTGPDGTGFDDITELSFDTLNSVITTAQLTGAELDAVWTLTNADHTYQIGGRELIFRSADRLQGGSGADTFNVNGAYMGNLSGGDGADRIVLGMGGSVSGTLSGEAGMDTLQGRNADSIWSVTGLDFGSYQSSGINQMFSVIETLQGGSADDRFVLDGGSLTGQLLGGAGSNHLVYDSGAGPISVVLSGSGTNVGFAGMEQCPCLTGGFDDITELSQVDGGELTGWNAASAWTLAAVSDMSMYSQGGRTLVFRGATQLQGGTGVDTFTVEEEYAGALSGGNGADRFVLDAEVTGMVSGEAGADTFVLQASGSARSLDGGTDIDTLQGRDVDSIWTLTGSTTGTYMAGSSFRQDFSNTEVLAGGTGADTFNVNTDYTGSMVGGGGDDIYNLNARLSTSRALDGGAGSDSYIFGVNGLVRAGIDDTGTSGEDDLGLSSTATDGATFTINAMGAGRYKLTAAPADRASPFAGIETLQGGGGADIFNLEADHTGDLSGGRGNDIFNLGAIVTGEVSGGDDDDQYKLGAGGRVTGGIMDTGGDDTLESTTMAGATFTLDTTNTYESASLSTTFSGIDNLAGGSGADSFTLNSGNLGGAIAGHAGRNTYNLAGGIVTGGITAGEDGDTFNVIAAHAGALTGGMGADTFNLDAELIGMVDGGEAGDNYRLGTGGEVSGGIADTGGTGMDTLTGHDADRDWTVTASGEGSYGTQVAFSGVENLQGGSGADDFVFNAGGSVSGRITGGGGTNHLDYSGLSTAVAVALTGTGTATGFAGTATATGGIADITELSGSMATTDLLVGQDAASTWTLPSGDDAYISDARTLSFRGVENLQGGSSADDFTVSGAHSGELQGGAGADSFTLTAVLSGDILGASGANTYTFNSGGAVSGTVTGGANADDFVFAGGSVSERVVGGAGANHLDYGGFSAMVEVALTGTGMTTGFAGTGPAVMMGFDDITELSGGSAMDRLTGQDVASTWTLTSGDDAYESASRTLSFRAVEDLQGGSGADDFTVSGAYGGDLRGGAGVDSFTLGAMLTGSIAGEAGDNSYTFNSGGEVIGTVTGGADRDDFVFAGGSVSGVVTGGGGANHLDYSGLSTAVAVALDSTGTATGFAGTATVTGGIDDITELSGGTGGMDQLTGLATDSVWTLLGGATHSYESASRTLSFRSVENLQGDSGADDFVFTGGSVSGRIAGGAGANHLDYSGLSTAVAVALTGTGTATGFAGTATATGGVADITELSGGSARDQLMGQDADATWTLTSGDDEYESASRILSFRGVENLQGGTGMDDFTVSGAHSGELQGGAGSDSFTLGAMLTGSIAGEAGDNSYTFSSGGAVSGTVTGGTDRDDFVFAGGSVSGAVTGGGGTNHLDYSGLSTAVAVALDSTGMATGFAGTATATGGVADITELSGGSVRDRLTGQDVASTWALGPAVLNGYDDEYSSAFRTLSFRGVEDLQGGSGADDFTVSGAHSGDLRGGAGADSFTLTAVLTGDIFGASGANTYTLGTNGQVDGAVTGGADADHFVFAGGSVSGRIAGGDGANHLDYSGFSTMVGVTLTGTGMTTGFAGTATATGSIADITELSGGSARDRLTGQDVASTWTLTSGDDEYESASRALSFRGVEDLQGGTGMDGFTVSGAHSGELQGGAGSDSFALTAVLTGSIAGEAGDNSYTLNSGGEVRGTVTGGTDADDFVFAGGSVSGVVTGGGGTNHLDYSGLSTAVAVALDGHRDDYRLCRHGDGHGRYG